MPGVEAPGVEVVNLQYPFELAGQRYDKITLGRLKAKQMKKITINGTGERPIAEWLSIVAASANLTEGIIEEVDGADLLTLIEVVNGFLSGGR